jgi:hypothetical protein
MTIIGVVIATACGVSGTGMISEYLTSVDNISFVSLPSGR